MTVQADFRLNLVAAMSGELPGVQVLPGPPGENQATDECVYVDGISSAFEWRSLGNLATNRTEDLSATVRAVVYREAPDQMDALADADARMDEIVTAVEAAVAPDPTVTGAVSFGLLESVDRSVAPVERGWVVTAQMRVTGKNYP